MDEQLGAAQAQARSHGLLLMQRTVEGSCFHDKETSGAQISRLQLPQNAWTAVQLVAIKAREALRRYAIVGTKGAESG